MPGPFAGSDLFLKLSVGSASSRKPSSPAARVGRSLSLSLRPSLTPFPGSGGPVPSGRAEGGKENAGSRGLLTDLSAAALPAVCPWAGRLPSLRLGVLILHNEEANYCLPLASLTADKAIHPQDGHDKG